MINLLPPKNRIAIETAKRNTILRRYLELAVLGVCSLAFLIVGSYYYLQLQDKNTKKTLDLNNQKLSLLEPVQDEAKQLTVTINTIAALFSREVDFSTMLTKIGQLMPPTSVLTNLEIDSSLKDSPLNISAQVDTEEKAAVLRNNLEKSELFNKAKIISIEKIAYDETTTATNTDEKDAEPVKDSPYRFTVQIEAYFSDTGDKK